MSRSGDGYDQANGQNRGWAQEWVSLSHAAQQSGMNGGGKAKGTELIRRSSHESPQRRPLSLFRWSLVRETPRPGTLRTTLAILPQVNKVSDRLVKGLFCRQDPATFLGSDLQVVFKCQAYRLNPNAKTKMHLDLRP